MGTGMAQAMVCALALEGLAASQAGPRDRLRRLPVHVTALAPHVRKTGVAHETSSIVSIMP